MLYAMATFLTTMVALLAEGVDRNHSYLTDTGKVVRVALLAEGVDRNRSWITVTWTSTVALLAEGVDRNKNTTKNLHEAAASPSSRRAWIEIGIGSSNRRFVLWSPSSRRAWIEILSMTADGRALGVALLAEGVDRNRDVRHLVAEGCRRPPRGGRG